MPFALPPRPIVEEDMARRKTKASATPTTAAKTSPGAADLRRAARLNEHDRQQAEQCARLASLPIMKKGDATCSVENLASATCLGAYNVA
jgi:hypothetical protein